MKTTQYRRSALLAAAGSLVLAAGLAAPAHASGDPFWNGAKYPTITAPYAAQPGPAYSAPTPQVPAATTDSGAATGSPTYPGYHPDANLGQGSGVGRAFGR